MYCILCRAACNRALDLCVYACVCAREREMWTVCCGDECEYFRMAWNQGSSGW